MRFVIITGMSGAGKNTAMAALEDVGYVCVDNLPIVLLPKFAQIATDGENAKKRGIAAGIDIRGEAAFDRLAETLSEMQEMGIAYEILFLDASDEVLIKRYKETRRTHPLSGRERIMEGIAEERKKLTFLRDHSDHIIDTSQLLVRDLTAQLEKIFVEDQEFRDLFVTVLSFGFKYGIPEDADLVFDVRFLPNPYYIEELRLKTGNDPEVRSFLAQFPETGVFTEKLVDMVRFLIPLYIKEGKHQLVIALGCTGGQHRSVAMAGALYEALGESREIGIRIEHRDLRKDAYTKGYYGK